MALENTTNQSQKPASRRRNKKSTADAKVEPPAAVDSSNKPPSIEEEDGNVDRNDPSSENPYIKELQKTIRNVNKKLSGMAKVDSIVAENPNVSVDDLVAQRKINQDQKAQILKKPGLQTQLKELEEQISMHKKIEEDFAKRLKAQKDRLQGEHDKELEEAKAAATPVPTPPQEKPKPDIRGPLLTLSKFLRAAAARRQESDESSEDSKGFEGVLLLLYGGDNAAVEAAEKLINGSSDLVPSTEGGDTAVSYSRVKQLATEYAPFATEEAWVNGVADASTAGTSADQTTSDPTIANASLTELNSAPAPLNQSADLSTISGTNQSTVDPSAANSAASAQPSADLEQSWVSVPRAPEETENHNAAASAAVPSNQTENWSGQAPPNVTDSWAEQTPTTQTDSWAGRGNTPQTESWADSPMDAPPSATGDGFHEVHHGRGPRGGRGGGGFDGRGRGRGPFRGGRGDFRGRGRGSFEGRGGGRGGGRGRPTGPPPI